MALLISVMLTAILLSALCWIDGRTVKIRSIVEGESSYVGNTLARVCYSKKCDNTLIIVPPAWDNINSYGGLDALGKYIVPGYPVTYSFASSHGRRITLVRKKDSLEMVLDK